MKGTPGKRKLFSYPLILIQLGLPAGVFMLGACNNATVNNRYKTLFEQDSILILQTQQYDSAIKGYVSLFNKIQENLEQIKSREHIITLNDESKASYSPMIDIRAIDNLIIANHRELNTLQLKLKNDSGLFKGFDEMVTHLGREVREQAAEVNVLQQRLAKADTAYQEIAQQFNDSMSVIQGQNKTITALTKNLNMVYYLIGTMKQLEEKKIIEISGGFAGIGKNITLKPGFSYNTFLKSDLTELKVIPLGAKLKKMITVHPPASFTLTGNDNSDTIHIINAASFWSQSKCLVIAVK